jgi:hypothetical protein
VLFFITNFGDSWIFARYPCIHVTLRKSWDTLQKVGISHFRYSFFENSNSQIPWPHRQNRIAKIGVPILAIHPDQDPNDFRDSHTLLTWWGERRKFYFSHWVQSRAWMTFQLPCLTSSMGFNDECVKVAMPCFCDHVWCAVEWQW